MFKQYNSNIIERFEKVSSKKGVRHKKHGLPRGRNRRVESGIVRFTERVDEAVIALDFPASWP